MRLRLRRGGPNAPELPGAWPGERRPFVRASCSFLYELAPVATDATGANYSGCAGFGKFPRLWFRLTIRSPDGIVRRPPVPGNAADYGGGPYRMPFACRENVRLPPPARSLVCGSDGSAGRRARPPGGDPLIGRWRSAQRRQPPPRCRVPCALRGRCRSARPRRSRPSSRPRCRR